METKRFGVRFYNGMRSANERQQKVSDLLNELATKTEQGEMSPRHHDAGQDYELRDLVSINDGAVIMGVFAVLRDDAPHIRQPDGSEEPIELDENAGIIEKNYFIYYRANEVLVYQINGRASHISKFEKYLTRCTGDVDTVSFGDILTLDAVERLRAGIVKSLEFRMARPRNAALLNPEDWEHGAFNLLDGADATTISVKVSTRSRGNGLSDRLRGAIHRLINGDTTRAVKVKLAGDEFPIDLLAECVKGRIEVEMHGLYPVPAYVFQALQAVKDRNQDMLDAFFGQGDAQLA